MTPDTEYEWDAETAVPVMTPEEAEQAQGLVSVPPGTVVAQADQDKRTIGANGFAKGVSGQFILNGRVYDFVSGGAGRGAIPFGSYDVGGAEDHPNLGGTSFPLSNHYDTTTGDERTGLFIHRTRPGREVTAGCIGVPSYQFDQLQRDLQTSGVKSLSLVPSSLAKSVQEAPIEEHRPLRGLEAVRSQLMQWATDQAIKEGVPAANAPYAAAIMVGQAASESSTFDPQESHDGGIGRGLYGANQDRLTAMVDWMAANKYPDDREGQIRHMMHEAMTSPRFTPTREVLMGANRQTLDSDAIHTVTKNFEAPTVVNDRRANVAEAMRAYRPGATPKQFDNGIVMAASDAPAGPMDVSKMPDYMKGGLFNPSELQEIERQKRYNDQKALERGHEEERAALRNQIKSDIAYIEKTGKVPRYENGHTSLEAASYLFGGRHAKEFQTLTNDWALATRRAQLVRPLRDMPEDEASDLLLHQPEPVPGVSEAVLTKAEDQAHAEFDRIKAERQHDIADAIDNLTFRSPEVDQARRTIALHELRQLNGEAVPEPMTQQEKNADLLRARLQTQERLRIPEGQRSPITREEAYHLLGALGDEVVRTKGGRIVRMNMNVTNMPQPQFEARIKAAAAEAERLYGREMAKPALEAAFSYMLRDHENRRGAANILANLSLGRSLTPNDVEKFRKEWSLGPQSHFLDSLSADDRKIWEGALGSLTSVKQLRPVSDTSVAPTAIAHWPNQPPNRAQIEALQQNPAGWEDFDAKFGPGTAAQYLVPARPKGELKEAQSPGIWQRIAAQFSGGGRGQPVANPNSPLEQIFRSAQPAQRAAQPARGYNPMTKAME